LDQTRHGNEQRTETTGKRHDVETATLRRGARLWWWWWAI